MLWLPLSGVLLGAGNTPDTIERLQIRTAPLAVSWLESPAAVQVRLIDKVNETDALALLQGISGLQADLRSNLAQDSRLSIRGFGSRSSFGVRGLRMTLDGIPLTTPDGQTQPSALLTADLASVTVLKGPFAALYGNAAGGVVAWESQPIEAGTMTYRQQQSHQMRQQNLQLDTGFGTLMWQQADFQGNRPHNRAERQSALWKQQWQLSDELVLKTRVDWSQDPRLDDPGALTLQEWQANPAQTTPVAMRFDSHKTTRQLQAGMSLQGSDWQFNSYQTSRQIRQLLTFTGDAMTSSGGVVQLARDMAGLQWQQQHQWQELAMQWSLSHEQSTDARLGFVNQQGQIGALRRDDRSRSRSQDATLRLSYLLTDDLTLFTGARLAWLNFASTDYFIVPGNPDDSGKKSEQGRAHALGFQYKLTPDMTWHGSTGRGFESPTLTEMAYTRNGSGLNLALEPAQNRQWDTGVKWLYREHPGWRSRAQLDLFYLTSSNELIVDSSIGGRTVFKNASGTRRQGVELSVQQEWADQWQLTYSLSWLDAVYTHSGDSYPGLQLPGVAAQQQQIEISYAPSNSWFSAFSYRRLSRVAADDKNQQFAPGYGLLDLNTGWRGQLSKVQWSVDFSAKNLTNQRYVGAVVVNQSSGRSFEPGAPRQVTAGFNLSFAIQ